MLHPVRLRRTLYVRHGNRQSIPELPAPGRCRARRSALFHHPDGDGAHELSLLPIVRAAFPRDGGSEESALDRPPHRRDDRKLVSATRTIEKGPEFTTEPRPFQHLYSLFNLYFFYL